MSIGSVGGRSSTPYLLLLPGIIVVSVFFGAMAVTAVNSFHDPSGTLSLKQYTRFLSDGFYRDILWRSLWIATYCTPITLFLGYPFAYVMALSGPFVRMTLMTILIVQLFTSDIVRTYSLILVFGNNGIINRSLLGLGVIDQPFRLLFHEAGVALGLVLVPLPFMIFPVYSVLRNIEPNLGMAAASLGADRTRLFFRITLPLSLPGIVAGVVLVFLFDLTAYVIPGMLGGGYFNMIANTIQEQAMSVLDKWFAGAISMLLLLITLLILYLIHFAGTRLQREH